MKLTAAVERDASLGAMRRSLCAAMWHSYSGTGYANLYALLNIHRRTNPGLSL
jgi:hypothetical protein